MNMPRSPAVATPRGGASVSPSGRAGDALAASATERLLVQFLRARGYQVAAPSDDTGDVVMEDPSDVAEAHQPLAATVSSMDQYAQQLGLSTDACAVNHLVRSCVWRPLSHDSD